MRARRYVVSRHGATCVRNGNFANHEDLLYYPRHAAKEIQIRFAKPAKGR